MVVHWSIIVTDYVTKIALPSPSISIDGQLFPAPTGLLVIDVQPGYHHIVVSYTGYYSYAQDTVLVDGSSPYWNFEMSVQEYPQTFITITKLPTTGGTFILGSDARASQPDGSYIYLAGYGFQLQATPADGYVFKGWEINGIISETLNPFNVNFQASASIKAVFDPIVAPPAPFPWWIIPIALIALAGSSKKKK